MLVAHLTVLRRGIRGPRRLRNAVLHEVLADLTEATEVYLGCGHDPVEAAGRAVRDFGDPAMAARGISEALEDTVRGRRARVIGWFAVSQLLLWCAIFLGGGSEPWSEREEPSGIDTSDLVATLFPWCAVVVAVVYCVATVLRRRGRITVRVGRSERALIAANLSLVSCGALALACSVGVRALVAPGSLSAPWMALAGCAVLALLARWSRQRLPRMTDPLD